MIVEGWIIAQIGWRKRNHGSPFFE